MQMRYFRRNALAGKSLKRLTSAQVRGNLRRSDIDQFSAVPYFANVVQGDTLIVEGVSAGVPTEATVGITATAQNRADFNQAIADLTAGLAAVNVKAFDDGGCLGLKSTLAGSAGRVRVTGGTAAKALGFDLQAQDFFSIGGDLVSSPEGRGLGQPYGAAVAVPGENLTTDAFSRAIGRVMANTDVLFADLMKQEVVMKKVATVTASPTPLSSILLGSAKVYIGAPNTREDLAHLFVLIDTATGQPAPGRVTAVWNTAGTILLNEYDQTIVAGTAINEILNGEVVRCDGGNFVAAGVIAGDYAEIYSAGNIDPFSNNGYRWVIDRVVDSTHVALRPMSTAELASVGQVLDDSQPIVELNSSSSGAWGSLRVKRGKFANGARLVLSTPIPLGMTVDVWAPVPATIRDRELDALAQRGYGVFSSTSHDFDPAPNALLTRPSVTQVADTIQLGAFMVRWHGRPIRVPPVTGLTFPGAISTQYIYWDEVNCAVAVSTTATSFSVTEARNGASPDELAGKTPNVAGKGQHIATVLTNGAGHIVTFNVSGRIVADQTVQMTVGHGAQFYTLSQALDYVKRLASSSLAASAQAQVEIVVVTDQTAPSGGWALPPTSVFIRGGNLGVQLIAPPSGPYFNSVSGSNLLLADLKLDLLRTVVSGVGTWWVRNLVGTGSSGYRTLDTSLTVDIGASAGAVAIGKSGAMTAVRGYIYAQEGIQVPPTRTVYIGPPSNNVAGVQAEVAGGVGQLVFGKTAEPTVTLDKDHVDTIRGTLMGGPATNADSQHIHKALEAGFTIAGVPTVVGPAAAGVTAANLNALTNGSNTALHNHNHGDQAGGSLHADAVANGADGFMTGADKAKLDGLVADNLLVHRAGVETITGVKTFTTNQLLDVAEAAITDANYPKHVTRRSYVRKSAHHPKWPGTIGSKSGAVVTDGQWLTWAPGQTDVPKDQSTAGVGELKLLVGSKTTPLLNNCVSVPVTPWTIPWSVPFGRAGNLCKFRLQFYGRVNDACLGTIIYVNGTLITGDLWTKAYDGTTELAVGARAPMIFPDSFTRTLFNEQAKWRSFFNLHGGLGGSGSVTQGEAAALASLVDAGRGINDAHQMSVMYEWDADPDVVHTISILSWAVTQTLDDGAGDHGNSIANAQLSVYDPTDISAYPYSTDYRTFEAAAFALGT